MEQLYLMPGEERYTKFQDENGVPKIHYTYCSLHGKKPTEMCNLSRLFFLIFPLSIRNAGK